MAEPHDIAAVFFDMDGTLIDSELNTEPAIAAVCAELGVKLPSMDYTVFYGRQWPEVVDALVLAIPELAGVNGLARRLHRAFHELCRSQPTVQIPGAREAVIQLNSLVPTAIVSSAYRESIEATIADLDLAAFVTCYAGAEDYAASKPAPDGFLYTAKLVNVDPANCLVFEDSIVGLEAARAAGMWAVAITHRSNDESRARKLGHMAISDYTKLRAGFFAEICAG